MPCPYATQDKFFRLLDQFKEPAPPNLIQEIRIAVKGQPDEEGFTDDVILRHEAPVTRVERIVAVIAHHEVIILLEGVLAHLLAVDV